MAPVTRVYTPDIEQKMGKVFHSLSEKDQRRNAAAEAVKVGHGGTAYIARLFGCSREKVEHGLRDLEQLPEDPAGQRVRRAGAGRPRAEQKQPRLVEQVQQTIRNRTAGDPMRDDVRWTDLTPRQISAHLAEAEQTDVAPSIVRRILDQLGYGLRKIAKVLPGKHSPDRDRQFLRIAELKQQFLAAGRPVLSIDTKKKEFL